MADHVNTLVFIPPQIAVSSFKGGSDWLIIYCIQFKNMV